MAPGLDSLSAAQYSPAILVRTALEDEFDVHSKAGAVAVELRWTGPQGRVEPFTAVRDPAAWFAADWQQDRSWVYELTPGNISELDAALARVEREGLDIQAITQQDFPLPTLGPKLQAFAREVRQGRGFHIIRGLPVDRYTRRQTVTAYWGLGTYWTEGGTFVSQNAKGHLIGHVKNIDHDPLKPDTRVYATNLAQPYHTDSADMVALLALKSAAQGGESSWCSSTTVINELLRAGRLDLVQQLAGDLYMDRKGEIPEGRLPYFNLPAVHYHQGYLTVSYSATYYELAQRHAEVPRLTPGQREALRAVNALARSDALRMDWALAPGDIQLLNNHTMLHMRAAFTDAPDFDERQHLLRLWVSSPGDRPLPPVFANLWGSTQPGARGGIRVPGYRPSVPLEAE